MTYGKTKEYTPEERDKIREARREQAIFAGYYRPKFNKVCRDRQRRMKK